MKIIKCKNYEEMSVKAAEIFAQQINEKPDSVLGLATGSTPLGLYAELIKMYNDGKIDFSKCVSLNLDEYSPIAYDNDQSYHYFMNENLFKHVNISESNFPSEDDPKAYDALAEELGGIDIQLLGIGENGHIGFNEPGDVLIAPTHMTGLTESTIKANARFFESEDDVPKAAITMGIATIMKAKKVVLMASGAKKRDAVMKILADNIDPQCPATILKAHPDVILICDEEAID